MKLAHALVLIAPLASLGCGVEAADPDQVTTGVAMQTSSGHERAPQTIVHMQTRHGTVSIDSTRDGIRYGVDDTAGVSLDQLRTDQPELYEMVRRAAASSNGGIDARGDPALFNPGARDGALNPGAREACDGVLIGDLGE